MHFSDFKDSLSNLMRFKNEEVEPQFEFFSFILPLQKPIPVAGTDLLGS